MSNWHPLTALDHLDAITEASFQRPQLLFKHSTRCSISSGAKSRLDSGLAALLQDMDDRGLLKETLVVAIGEFGHSPRLGVSTSGNGNAPDGRDHWPYCYTALVAGAGVSRGALYGKSDATASEPDEDGLTVEDMAHTVYHCLGIDAAKKLMSPGDRPIDIVREGHIRKELLG